MKIFYGVQGTGNGHITRARVMAKELYATNDFDITFQFTGRPEDQFFDMAIFKNYQYRKGLTFNTHKGKVNYVKTALQAKPIQFLQDIKSLDLSTYDLIISDFEPVTAWAGKLKKKKVLGIGHQYAFNHKVPRTGSDPLADAVMEYFAPATQGIGLHWHHFDQPIFPPIIEQLPIPETVISNKIVVYLPFEDQTQIIEQLKVFKEFEFHVYAPIPVKSPYENIICNPLSRDGFQKDLIDCTGIISNAGFELASEALQLGKKILTKPLLSQMEQISNAAALSALGYGDTMNKMDSSSIENWLAKNTAVRVTYPNVAAIIVKWIKDGQPEIDSDFIKEVWSKVNIIPVKF